VARREETEVLWEFLWVVRRKHTTWTRRCRWVDLKRDLK